MPHYVMSLEREGVWGWGEGGKTGERRWGAEGGRDGQMDT